MRTSRLIAGLLSAGLLGLTPLAVLAPAEAGNTYQSVITFKLNQLHDTPVYGDDFYVSGRITDPTGIDGPTGGTASLQVLTAANPVWTTIATDTQPSYLYFDADFKHVSSAQFRVVYTGYTATSDWDDSFLPAESAPVAVDVLRKLTIKNPRNTYIVGKVAPDYKRGKVLIHKKVGKSWRKYRTLKTNKKSSFSITLPASRKRTYWRITVPGTSEFAKTTQVGSTISYREAARRAISFR